MDTTENLQKRIAALESTLHDVLDYLHSQIDVVDGVDGIPAPNRAMSLALDIQLTLDPAWR